jgi:hypothetical protein
MGSSRMKRPREPDKGASVFRMEWQPILYHGYASYNIIDRAFWLGVSLKLTNGIPPLQHANRTIAKILAPCGKSSAPTFDKMGSSRMQHQDKQHLHRDAQANQSAWRCCVWRQNSWLASMQLAFHETKLTAHCESFEMPGALDNNIWSRQSNATLFLTTNRGVELPGR